METNRTPGQKQAHFAADPSDDALFGKWDVWGKLPVRTFSPPPLYSKGCPGTLDHSAFITQQICERLVHARYF